MHLRRTVRTDRPLERVYAYLSDFTTTNEWDPGTVDTVRLSGDGGVGTVYANTSRFAGRETKLTYTVLEHTEDVRLVLRGENRTVTATDTMTFRATGSGPTAGTEVDYDVEFRFPLASVPLVDRLTGLVLAPFLKRLGDDAQQGMTRALARL